MRVNRVALAMASLLAMALMLPSVQAYTSQGTDPSAESPHLYVHRNTADAAYWLSNVAAESDADDVDPGYNVLGIAPLGAAGLGCGDAAEYCWQITMDPAPSTDIQLDSSIATKFHLIYRGILSAPLAGGVAGGYPAYGSIHATLTVDGTTLASVDGTAGAMDGSWEVVDLEGDTQLDVIPAGAVVMLDVRFKGVSVGAVLGADNSHEGNTHVTLPIPSAGPVPPSVIRANLAEATAMHEFANATDDDYQLNFTGVLNNGTTTFEWNATSGKVAAVLIDDVGAEIYNGTFEGNGTLSEDFAAAMLGNWSMMLDYQNFTGTFGFSVHETPAGTVGNGTGGSGSGGSGSGGSGSGGSGGSGSGEPGGQGSGGASGNGTGNETVQSGGNDKESPVVPIVMLVLGLMFVAFRRRM